MQLQRVVLAIMPFVLVALLHHLYYTTHAVPDGVASRAKLRVARSGGRVHPAVVPGGKHAAGGATPVVEAGGAASGAGQRGAGGAASPGAAAAPATAAASAASGSALVSPSASALPERPGMHVYNRLLRSTPVGAGASGPSTFTAANGWADFDDFAARYPPPTLSATRLLDGSPNYLPVPDADSDDPTDLRWRKEIRPGAPCPKGRRPFHVLLTAQASAYQEWQSKIMHYHYRKTVAANPCTEMTGWGAIPSPLSPSPFAHDHRAVPPSYSFLQAIATTFPHPNPPHPLRFIATPLPHLQPLLHPPNPNPQVHAHPGLPQWGTRWPHGNHPHHHHRAGRQGHHAWLPGGRRRFVFSCCLGVGLGLEGDCCSRAG